MTVWYFNQVVPLSIAGIVAGVQQIVVFAVWRMTPTCFCVLGVHCLHAFSFSLFHRWSNNKSPQKWRSRIKQQNVLLGDGFHVFFAFSFPKIASKGVSMKLWTTKAHANCSLKHKLWPKAVTDLRIGHGLGPCAFGGPA